MISIQETAPLKDFKHVCHGKNQINLVMRKKKFKASITRLPLVKSKGISLQVKIHSVPQAKPPPQGVTVHDDA